MAILAECPVCRRKQSVKNKKCACGLQLDETKKSKKVRYWISYRMPDGKQRRESVGSFEGLDAYSITDAKNAESKRVVQKVEKRIFDMLPGSNITFSELAEWYKELKTVKRLSSYNRVKIALNNFNEVFGNRIVSTLRPEDLENYQEDRQGQGIADATIDMELSIAQTMVDKAFVNDRVDGRALKPFKVIKRKLVKGSNARSRKATIEEYLKLCGNAPIHLKPMIITAMNTGMRPSEIRTLKWSYIDKEKTLIVLPPEVTKEGKKTRRGKRIPINYHVKAVLDAQPHALHHGYVFTYKGNPLRGPQGVRKAFKTACKATDIPYGKSTQEGLIFADFRRTVKTYMVEAGVDKVYRDTILGHSLKGMDIHYIKPSDEALRTALDKYTEWLDNQIAAKTENVDHSVDQMKIN